MTTFLHYVLGADDQELSERMTWFSSSIGQVLLARGQYKPANHILSPLAVKSLTGISLQLNICNFICLNCK